MSKETSPENNQIVVPSSENDTSASMPANPQPAKKSNGVAVFAILLSLAALGGSGFTWFQTQVQQVQEESRLSAGVTEIGGQISRLGDTVARLSQDQLKVASQADLENTVLKINASVRDQMDGIVKQQTALIENQQAIRELMSKGANDYVVEEVAQLLRLANNAIVFSADVDSALNALSLASNQLMSLNNPAYSRVRLLVSQEIESLKNVNQVDISALIARLNKLASSIPSLPLANEPDVIGEVQVSSSVPTDLSIGGQLAQIWRDMLDSVRIQRVDQAPKALLAPQERYFLDQNISLSLSKAELALMQNEHQIYVNSLAHAGVFIREYFDLSDEEVTKVLASLEELAGTPLLVDLPDISGSYQVLQSIAGQSQ